MGMEAPLRHGLRSVSRRAFAAVCLALGVWPAASTAKPPPGYPRSYQRLMDAADREGRLVVYSAADVNEMDELLRAFRAAHPRIRLQYEHMASKTVYDRYVAEIAAGKPSADLVFNSAMDRRSSWSTTATPRPTPLPRSRTCRRGRCGRTRPTGSPPSRSSSPTTSG
jgi:hypothetical protein